MTIKRLLAIAAIFICTSVCWGLLGTSLLMRTTGSFDVLGQAVAVAFGDR